MKWIYLSPHLDDAIYSCGALIHQQVQQGQSVEIWTLFSGSFIPEKLTPFAIVIHDRWGTGLQSNIVRRAEDEQACSFLGAVPRYFDFPDVVYRFKADGSAEIKEDDDLFRSYGEEDQEFMLSIRSDLQQALQKEENVQVCAPLSLGNHIDHQIVRHAADGLVLSSPLKYFADFPYIVRSHAQVKNQLFEKVELSKNDVDQWCKAIALYRSQVSTFWADTAEICNEINSYWHNGGGSCLWIDEQ